jgi:SAM-dependent methyltransferase
MGMTRWADFWNADNPIYVSERHKLLHYRLVARDIVALMDALALGKDAVVLDYGCGEALSADLVAHRSSCLTLCDAAPTIRERLTERFAGNPKIDVMAPEEVDALPDGAFDLIVVNSLVQYLSRSEFAEQLAVWREKLKSGGHLVLADIIPPQVSPLADARALLSFAAKGGFLGAALVGLARTFFSDYRRLRGELGLAQYDEAEMMGLMAAAGLSAARRPRNLGHNQARMTFVARASGAAQGPGA